MYSAAFVVCAGRDDAEIRRRATAISREVDELRSNTPLVGTPAEIVDRLAPYLEAGVQRVYLQLLDLSDLDHIELFPPRWSASGVMPNTAFAQARPLKYAAVAKYDPAGATGYSAGGTGTSRTLERHRPARSHSPTRSGPSPTSPIRVCASTAAARPSPVNDADTPTDPADGFGGRSTTGSTRSPPTRSGSRLRPWYRKQSATIAFAAIGVAVAAILVAAVLLVERDSQDSGGPTTNTTSTAADHRAVHDSADQFPACRKRRHHRRPTANPPDSPTESAQPRSTETPQYSPPSPQYSPPSTDNRPNVTTPQTRPPQMSVRPTHRPAFPNQPGGG